MKIDSVVNNNKDVKTILGLKLINELFSNVINTSFFETSIHKLPFITTPVQYISWWRVG